VRGIAERGGGRTANRKKRCDWLPSNEHLNQAGHPSEPVIRRHDHGASCRGFGSYRLTFFQLRA
jgi:hypothetical protein